jgi:hypothetical protein
VVRGIMGLRSIKLKEQKQNIVTKFFVEVKEIVAQDWAELQMSSFNK